MAQAKSAKKTTTSKSTARTSSSKKSSGLITDTVQQTAMAGLGIFGKVYDRAQDRVEDVRKEVPKQWEDFVKRGEQLKDTANDKVNGINFSYKFDMEEQRSQFRDVVDALRAFVTPSKA